jgi:hypothetical protein
MSKLDDTKDVLLDAMAHAAAQLQQTTSASHVDSWGKAVANLGQAYMSLSSDGGGLWGHVDEGDEAAHSD